MTPLALEMGRLGSELVVNPGVIDHSYAVVRDRCCSSLGERKLATVRSAFTPDPQELFVLRADSASRT